MKLQFDNAQSYIVALTSAFIESGAKYTNLRVDGMRIHLSKIVVVAALLVGLSTLFSYLANLGAQRWVRREIVYQYEFVLNSPEFMELDIKRVIERLPQFSITYTLLIMAGLLALVLGDMFISNPSLQGIERFFQFIGTVSFGFFTFISSQSISLKRGVAQTMLSNLELHLLDPSTTWVVYYLRLKGAAREYFHNLALAYISTLSFFFLFSGIFLSVLIPNRWKENQPKLKSIFSFLQILGFFLLVFQVLKSTGF